MPPRGTPNPKSTISTPMVHRTISKSVSKPRSSPRIKARILTSVKNTMNKDSGSTLPRKDGKNQDNITSTTKQNHTKTVSRSMPATPNAKENKQVVPPGSVTKSGKKPGWKRRPKPAHSGVPVPEKMKKLLGKCFNDDDDDKLLLK